MITSNGFEITARTCCLSTDNTEEVLFKSNTLFQIPVFQRPYSWKQPQVHKLLTDLITCFLGKNGKAPREPMFIGTMQLSSPEPTGNKVSFPVIDGQQRLCTLILILNKLQAIVPDHRLFKTLEPRKILITQVSKDIQQTYWSEALEHPRSTAQLSKQNPYLDSIYEIANGLGQLEGFDFSAFITYLATNIYFVVIETHANLSKTLQIFDAINTAGMTLNGGDIFKVRYFDYLKNTQGSEDNVFDDISALYELVDQKNKAVREDVCTIESALGLLKHVLVSKHGLSKDKHMLGATRFFEQLFDTVLNVNHWPGFNFEKCKCINIEICEIQNLIDSSFAHHDHISKWGVDAKCALRFINTSRYGRYRFLPILFLNRFNGSSDQNQRFALALSKLLSTLSILKKKRVKEGDKIMIEIMDKMFASPADDKAEDIIEEILRKTATRRAELESTLKTKKLAYDVRAKYLVCRYIALLDELETGPCDALGIEDKLFEIKIDIEHIEPVIDANKKDRPDWENELHGIGNLIILERSSNRSISNNDYLEKAQTYAESEFSVVRNQAMTYKTWEPELCKKRKETEIERLVKYLCSE